MYFRTVPDEKRLEVFTSMPKRFRRVNVRSDWADANKAGSSVESFREGPTFDQAGNLYVTDIPYGRVFRISASGEWTLVVEYDGEPNGLALVDEGHLAIADYKKGLLQLDIKRGEICQILLRRNAEGFKGLNDLAVSSTGDIYYTDQGQTGLRDPTDRVFRLRKAGQLDLLLGNVPSPNGLVLSPDEKVLFVAATAGIALGEPHSKQAGAC